ncbi:MAG: hypothetical protein VW339_07680, partial [Quisquiliibacterium sp.]
RDSRGRVSSHQLSLQLHDGSWRNYQTHFWRDAAGRLASWSLPGGGRLHLRRDSAGQVVGLYWQPSGLSSRLPVVHKLGRDVNGLGRMVLGNRVVAHFERDDKGHLARLVHRLPGGLRPSTVLLDHRLEHDHHGRLLGWSDGTQQRRYLVDATGRLLQAAHRSAVGSAQFWRFAYDAQGNRRFAQAPTPNAPAGLTQKFQRDGLSNRLASPGRSTPGQTSQQA